MNGTIVIALKKMVTEKFGSDKWSAALKKAGIDKEPVIMATSDMDDKMVLDVIKAVCDVLHITWTQAADAFGEYWAVEYAPKVFPIYYSASSAKDFLLRMDSVHERVTKTMPNAHPPRFDYEWKNDKTLVMIYKSQRGLVDLVVGLAKGVGKYYKENLKVTKVGNDRVEITFP